MKDTPSRPASLSAVAAFVLTFATLALVRTIVDPPLLLADRFIPGAGWAEMACLAAWAAFLVSRMMNPRVASRWRSRLWLVFSVVFFAQLALGLAGFERFLMTGELHVPVPAVILAGPLYRGEGLFMPILFGATLLLAGPAWCSYLCYLGAWDDATARATRRPRPLPSWRRPVQIGLLVCVVAAALVLRWAGVRPAPAWALALAFGVAGVLVMVAWSRRTGQMTHCITWCPMGLLATWLGRISPFRLRIADSCNDCGACTTFCRYHALSPGDITRRTPGITCTLCGDCLRSCKERSITYHFPGLSHDTARRVFLVLVVSQHAVFLGLART
ncbi:MAG: 4Fe-4S binding protein [Deltaproteobacteria bacterium]|nr:4Fe-4S binding protein [Deltaproteobacteria bacterium]